MGAPGRFGEWVDWLEKSQAEVGDLIGCHQTMVARLMKGGRTPGLGLALRIQELSAEWPEGPIRASEWVSQVPAVETEASSTPTVVPHDAAE